MLRIIQFFIAWLSVWLPVAIPLGLGLGWRPFQPIAPAQKIPLLISLYLLAPPLICWLGGHWGRSSADYGLVWNRSLLTSTLTGFGIAILSLIVLWGSQWSMGWLRWQPQLAQPDCESSPIGRFLPLLPIFALAILIGFVEEIVFRGLVLTELSAEYSLGLAAILSSLIFAGLHLMWDVSGTLPQLGGLWLMGLVLVLSRWLDDGSLGLAWGLHAGWVAGIAAMDMMPTLQPTGAVPQWLTGLNSQPLAGFAGLFLMGSLAIAGWLAL